MLTFNFLNRKRAKQRANKKRSTALALECLESRALLSATPFSIPGAHPAPQDDNPFVPKVRTTFPNRLVNQRNLRAVAKNLILYGQEHFGYAVVRPRLGTVGDDLYVVLFPPTVIRPERDGGFLPAFRPQRRDGGKVNARILHDVELIRRP